MGKRWCLFKLNVYYIYIFAFKIPINYVLGLSGKIEYILDIKRNDESHHAFEINKYSGQIQTLLPLNREKKSR